MSIDRILTQPGTRNPRRTGFFGWIYLALQARRQRRALGNLPAERLDDIGLTPDAARKEANLPVWNVPQHWLR